MLAIAIKKGKRPLQGIKALVSIEISFSLGESIILQPTTPSSVTTKSHAHGSNKIVTWGILEF